MREKELFQKYLIKKKAESSSIESNPTLRFKLPEPFYENSRSNTNRVTSKVVAMGKVQLANKLIKPVQNQSGPITNREVTVSD